MGKLGKKGLLHYVEQTSDWHKRVKHELFVSNDELPFMSHTDRTIFTLHQYDINFSENEFFGMKLTDGLYDEDNVKYMKPWSVSNRQRCNIGFIMHWADHMSTLIEQQSVK